MSEAEHKSQAPASVCCVVVTISDTRTIDNDTSGNTIADLLVAAGHKVSGRAIRSPSTAPPSGGSSRR